VFLREGLRGQPRPAEPLDEPLGLVARDGRRAGARRPAPRIDLGALHQPLRIRRVRAEQCTISLQRGSTSAATASNASREGDPPSRSRRPLGIGPFTALRREPYHQCRMAPPASLEISSDIVRLRSGERGRRVLVEHPPHVPRARPFLKWAGGKQWLVPVADALLPSSFTGRYFEPFLGAGALFFALSPARAILADSNAELITSYQALRDAPESVIELLKSYPHDRTFFEALRDQRPKSGDAQAARLIYLNRTAFNGLYRVSRSGRFNVPFGNYANPTICNEERLRSAATTLQKASLSDTEFAGALDSAGSGDFAYLDPPYITGHTNNGFLKYNARLFSWSDQLKLAQQVKALSSQGVRVAVSNADHADVLALYRGLHCYRVGRRSAIGGGVDYRGRVSELLLTNFPLFDVETPTVR